MSHESKENKSVWPRCHRMAESYGMQITETHKDPESPCMGSAVFALPEGLLWSKTAEGHRVI